LKEQFNDDTSVLADAKNQMSRMKILFDGGAVTKAEFENAKIQYLIRPSSSWITIRKAGQ